MIDFGDDFLTFDGTDDPHHPGFKDVFENPHHHHHHHHHSVNPFASYPSSYYTLNSLYSKPNFVREFTDVRQTEEGLTGLLADFHQNKLNAFGQNITLENMIKVREMQENLARLHFEINIQQSNEQQQSPTNSPIIDTKQMDEQQITSSNYQSNNSSNNKINTDTNNDNKIDETNNNQYTRQQSSSSTSSISSGSSSGLSSSTQPKTINSNKKQPITNNNPNNSNNDDDPSMMMMMSKPFSKSNMMKLIQNLQNLCQSIEVLQLKNAVNE